VLTLKIKVIKKKTIYKSCSPSVIFLKENHLQKAFTDFQQGKIIVNMKNYFNLNFGRRCENKVKMHF